MDEKVRRGLFSIAKDKLLKCDNETLQNILNNNVLIKDIYSTNIK